MSRSRYKKNTKGIRGGMVPALERILRGQWRIAALAVLLIAVAAGISGGVLLSYSDGEEKPDLLRAVIVDQNYAIVPNADFIEKATQYLEDFGFEVDLYQGDAVTVDVYRRLAEQGYKLVILRCHSALRLHNEESNYGTWLFSSEPYSENKYASEQQSGRIAQARFENDDSYPWLFAVGSKFVARSMKGKFDDTAVIMMGCGPMYLEDMAQAFVGRGASVCLGWNERASWAYLDNATLSLLSKMLLDNMPVDQAVSGVMAEAGPGLEYEAALQYYPREAAGKNLSQLLKWLPDAS